MQRTLAAVAVLMLALEATAAESVRWTLAEALSRAVERNLTLRQRQIDVDARREAWQSSWNLYLPSIDAGVGLRRADSSDPPWSLSAELGARLALDATLPDQAARSQLAWHSAIIAWERARLQLLRDVEKLFYQVLLVQERIRLAEQNAQLAARQYDRTLRLFEAGQASDLDLLAARVARENTVPELLSLRSSLESLRTRLKQLAGLAAEDDLALVGEIALPVVDLDAPRLLQEVERSSPAVRELVADLETRRIDRRISARSARTPSLSLGYSWAPQVSGPIAANIDSPDSYRDRGTLSLGLSMPLDPLIPLSREDQRLRELDAGIERARVAIDEALYISRMEVSSLLNQLAGIEQTIRARELAETRAQEVYNQTLSAYDRGGRDLLDVQDAQAGLLQAQVSILNEKYNYIAVLADLEFAVGRRLIKE